MYAANLALEFRQTFGRDCVLDIFCFRRHGHNEADDPSFTHPRMYKYINKHPGLATLYGWRCINKGVVTKEEQKAIADRHMDVMKQAHDRSKAEPGTRIESNQGPDWVGYNNDYSYEPVDTCVEEPTLRTIASHITTPPDGFHIHRSLKKILERQRKQFDTKSTFHWAFAESLAFGSLVLEGFPIRLSGEDCDRGTFSQRHLTWWDTESERPLPHTPLKTLSPDQARFRVYDSPLSEYSIVGFEYGYSLVDPKTLVVWEAQFGDFANGAQVIIDNYIASGKTKWNRSSGLVLLLPHGIEGQGPEHSSAYLERYLKLASDDNIQVCNVTTPAQYFHLLRRQVKANYKLPLIIMTPKSLLRHARAVSTLDDLTTGQFHQVLVDPNETKATKRILICTGKIYYDLLEHKEAIDSKDTVIIRLEQMYPFPTQDIRDHLAKYPSVNHITWVQEESQNTGAWSFVHERFSRYLPEFNISYLGRHENFTTATGSHTQYLKEQKKIVENAFSSISI